MSLRIERATPGYWIFSASSRPSTVRARCTCPIDAAAIGCSSKRSKRRRQPLPYSRPSTPCSCAAGIGAACERRIASACANSGGRRSGPCIDIICPSFIAPPRSRASRAARRRALSAETQAPPAPKPATVPSARKRRTPSPSPASASSPAARATFARRPIRVCGTRVAATRLAGLASSARPGPRPPLPRVIAHSSRANEFP